MKTAAIVTALALVTLVGGLGYGWRRASTVAPGTPLLASTVLAQPLPQPYRADAAARDDVERAFARAAISGRRVLVNLGANWCPDCRALAGMFALPDFKRFIDDTYEHVYVDVNRLNRNMDVAESLGLAKLDGIPTVLVFSPKRELLNRTTSKAWTSASSRNAQQAMDYFASAAK